jgi:hypothetical protein
MHHRGLRAGVALVVEEEEEEEEEEMTPIQILGPWLRAKLARREKKTANSQPRIISIS